MKINRKTKTTTECIRDIRVGDTFEFNSSVYMLTERNKDGYMQVVDLIGGDLGTMSDDTAITVVHFEMNEVI